MASNFPDDGLCHETSGFLFNHRCDRFSVTRCIGCEKPLCDDHQHDVDEGILCTSCLKRRIRQRDDDDRTGTSSTDSRYDDHYDNSPYFYSTRHYPNYGSGRHSQVDPSHSDATSGDLIGGDFSDAKSPHDPMDFTEGDAESFRLEGDGQFESDMGAS